MGRFSSNKNADLNADFVGNMVFGAGNWVGSSKSNGTQTSHASCYFLLEVFSLVLGHFGENCYDEE